MIIGVPKEIKNNEFRVGMIPSSVQTLVEQGHQVLVEKSAGIGIGFSDHDYRQAGAQIKASPNEVFAQAEMIVKVKEPQISELPLLRQQQILFTYLHLAADPNLTQALINSGAVCIAYETVHDVQGRLPLLFPMSEVAGRMSIQVGAHSLEKMSGGRGILLGGVTGVAPANVMILGGGTVGKNAAQMALGLGASVTIFDRNTHLLSCLDEQFSHQIQTVLSTPEAIEKHLAHADLVIGAVLVPGASTPKLVTKTQIQQMKPGAVVVDVAIDQGGCIETSRPTSHQHPTFVVDGVVHYCVTNMPGAVPRTSAFALNNATLPYIVRLANLGLKQALLDDRDFQSGVNVMQGEVTCENVAASLGLNHKPLASLLNAM